MTDDSTITLDSRSMSLVPKTRMVAKADIMSSNIKGKKQKRIHKSRNRDYIWKIFALISIPLVLFSALKSGRLQGSSGRSSSGELDVKKAELEPLEHVLETTQESTKSDTKMQPENSANDGRTATPPLQIQIASDLHIEFYDKDEDLDFLIEPKAPILALLGDVGYACTEQLRKYLLSQANRFEEVWFLAGNHEYYNHGTKYSVTEQNAWLQQVASERPNLKYLEKTALPFFNGRVVVLATTLWSDIPDNYLEEAEHFLNDYHRSYNHGPNEATPRLLRATETRQWYRDNLNWLQTQLQGIYDQNKAASHQSSGNAIQTKVIVLTHHTPLITGTSAPQYEGQDSTHCFSSDLQSLLVHPYSPIDVWACGHTHYNFDLQLAQSNRSDDGKRVRVVSNQRGYKNRPKPDYQPDGIVLEIDPSV